MTTDGPIIAFVLTRGARFSPDIFTGAVEMTAADIIKASRFQSDIHVLGPPQEDPDGKPVRTYPCAAYHAIDPGSGKNDKPWWQGLGTTLEDLRPDIVVVEQSPKIAAWVRRQGLTDCVLVHRHDAQSISSPLKAWVRRWQLDRADGILANSEFTRRHHIDAHRCHPDRVVRLYNGIEVPRQIDLSSKEKLVVCVAAMVPKKGPDLFVDAVRMVAKSMPDWAFELVSETTGRAPEAWRTELKNAIEECGSALTWHDGLTHEAILELYRRAAVAVVPSRVAEGFGRTALEAVAYGAALVHSPLGALPEIAGGHGRELKPLSADALAREMQTLAGDPDLQEKIARNAHRRALDLFDLSRTGARFDAIVEAVHRSGSKALKDFSQTPLT